MRVGIAQGPQSMKCMKSGIRRYIKKQFWQRNLPIIVFLTCCIPKGKFNVLSVYFDVCYVVLENGGNVNLK